MANNIELCEALPKAPILPDTSTALDEYQPLADLPEGYSLAVCVLPSQETRANIQAASSRLQQEFRDHHYAPERYLHMTLAYLGVVATAQEVEGVHAAYDKDLLKIASNIPPFEILIKGIQHFPKCFFAHVYNNEDSLDPLHDALAALASNVKQPGFIPHMTMGYPKGYAYNLFAAINARYAHTFFGEDTVDTIYLTSVHTRASLTSPHPIKILAEYPLGSK